MRINLIIDDCPVAVASGATILDAARALDIAIPTLCHDPRLQPDGNCGLCLVEVRRADGWVQTPACAAPATPELVVRTESAALTRARRWNLELLFSHHTTAARHYPDDHRQTRRPDWLVCACQGHKTCALRALCRSQRAEPDRLEVRAEPGTPVQLRDGLELEMSKCVRCNRCVRICREVVGVEALSAVNRGRTTEIAYAPPIDPEMAARCDGCLAEGGLCIDTCPTDALHPPRWQCPKGDKEG